MKDIVRTYKQYGKIFLECSTAAHLATVLLFYIFLKKWGKGFEKIFAFLYNFILFLRSWLVLIPYVRSTSIPAAAVTSFLLVLLSQLRSTTYVLYYSTAAQVSCCCNVHSCCCCCLYSAAAASTLLLLLVLLLKVSWGCDHKFTPTNQLTQL